MFRPVAMAQNDPNIGHKNELNVSILKAAIEVEKFGIEFYSNLSTCVKDERGAALLRSLAEDEKKHRAILEKEVERLKDTCDVTCVMPAPEYMKIVPERVFMPAPNTCILLEDEIKALEKGIEVEKRSFDMYHEAVERVSNEPVRKALSTLAEWEVTHRKILEENLRYLRLEGAWYGYSPILEG